MNREVKMTTQRGGVRARKTEGKGERRREKSIKMCGSRISSCAGRYGFIHVPAASGEKPTSYVSGPRQDGSLVPNVAGCCHRQHAAIRHSAAKAAVYRRASLAAKVCFFFCSANFPWAHQL